MKNDLEYIEEDIEESLFRSIHPKDIDEFASMRSAKIRAMNPHDNNLKLVG